MKKVLAAAAAAAAVLRSKNFPQTLVIASGSAASKNIKIFQHIIDKGIQNIDSTIQEGKANIFLYFLMIKPTNCLHCELVENLFNVLLPSLKAKSKSI